MNKQTIRSLELMNHFCGWVQSNDSMFPDFRIEAAGAVSKLVSLVDNTAIVTITFEPDFRGQTYTIYDPATDMYADFGTLHDACYQVNCWYGASVPASLRHALEPKIRCSISQIRNSNQLFTCTNIETKSHVDVLFLTETNEYFWNNRFHTEEELADNIKRALSI